MAISAGPRQVRLLACVAYSPGMEQRSPQGTVPIKGLDISNYIVNIDLYESVFDDTVSGSLTLSDTVGLPEYLPFVGVEYILIAFSVDQGDETPKEFRRIFRVVGLRDQEFTKNEERMFTVDIATSEFVTSVSGRVQKSYNGVTCSEGIQRILSEEMGVSNDRMTDIEKTTFKIDAIIPNYTPLSAVNYFTLLALNPAEDSIFLFYETLEGFHFNSLRNLLSPPDVSVLPIFNVNEGGVSYAKTINESVAFNSIIRLAQERSFNVLEDIAGGVLRSRVLHLDFLARKYAFTDTNYTDTFEESPHLSKFPVYPKNFDRVVNVNAKLFVLPSSDWSKDSKYVQSTQDRIDQDRLYRAIEKRNRQVKMLRHARTTIELPGQADIRAGSVVIINYPSSRPLEDSIGPSTSSIPANPSRYYSGAHLITSVRHILTRTGVASLSYFMHLEACRDSFGSPLVEFPKGED
jgi:hypothetical protein